MNGFEEFNDFTSFYYNISFPYVNKYNGFQKNWHIDINAISCGLSPPPWGTYCG
jgi:hypothetical protein